MNEQQGEETPSDFVGTIIVNTPHTKEERRFTAIAIASELCNAQVVSPNHICDLADDILYFLETGRKKAGHVVKLKVHQGGKK